MALVICLAVFSLMYWPMTKNDAGTLCSSRRSRTFGVVMSLGPSSKLSATYFAGALSASGAAASVFDEVRGAHDVTRMAKAMRRNLIIVLRV